MSVCDCCGCASSSPSYVPVVETYRLNHGVCDTGRGAAVRRYLRMYLPPSPADRDYRAGCLGAEVGLCFPRRDCDVRFRHACKCCTAIHAVTCRPVRRAQASAGLACCYASWPFRGCCSHTHRPEGARACVASLCPLTPRPAGSGWEPTSIIALCGQRWPAGAHAACMGR